MAIRALARIMDMNANSAPNMVIFDLKYITVDGLGIGDYISTNALDVSTGQAAIVAAVQQTVVDYLNVVHGVTMATNEVRVF